MDNEREIVSSPRETRNLIINGISSPRMSPYKLDESFIPQINNDLKIEVEEEIQIKIDKKKVEDNEEIDYSTLSADDLAIMREEYRIRRLILTRKHKEFEICDYVREDIPIKRTVEIHNKLVNHLNKLSSANKYKGIILGVFFMVEGVSKFFEYDFLSGITKEQREMIESYDSFLYEISSTKAIPELSTSNPMWGLFYTLGFNTLFIVMSLVLSKLLGSKEAGKALVKSVLDFFKPSSIKGKYMEEGLDGGNNKLIDNIMSMNNIVETGLDLKNIVTNKKGKLKRPV